MTLLDGKRSSRQNLNTQMLIGHINAQDPFKALLIQAK